MKSIYDNRKQWRKAGRMCTRDKHFLFTQPGARNIPEYSRQRYGWDGNMGRDDFDDGDDKNNITQNKNDTHTEIRVSLLAWLELFCILYDEYKIYRMAHGSWKILQNLMEEWICVYSEKLVSN